MIAQCEDNVNLHLVARKVVNCGARDQGQEGESQGQEGQPGLWVVLPWSITQIEIK